MLYISDVEQRFNNVILTLLGPEASLMISKKGFKKVDLTLLGPEAESGLKTIREEGKGGE